MIEKIRYFNDYYAKCKQIETAIKSELSEYKLIFEWDDRQKHQTPIWVKLDAYCNGVLECQLVYNDVIFSSDWCLRSRLLEYYNELSEFCLLVWESHMHELFPIWHMINNMFSYYRVGDQDNVTKLQKQINCLMQELTLQYLGRRYRIIIPFGDVEYLMSEGMEPAFASDYGILTRGNVANMVSDNPFYYGMYELIDSFKSKNWRNENG